LNQAYLAVDDPSAVWQNAQALLNPQPPQPQQPHQPYVQHAQVPANPFRQAFKANKRFVKGSFTRDFNGSTSWEMKEAHHLAQLGMFNNPFPAGPGNRFGALVTYHELISMSGKAKDLANDVANISASQDRIYKVHREYVVYPSNLQIAAIIREQILPKASSDERNRPNSE
jgi:hypothetical protein